MIVAVHIVWPVTEPLLRVEQKSVRTIKCMFSSLAVTLIKHGAVCRVSSYGAR